MVKNVAGGLFERARKNSADWRGEETLAFSLFLGDWRRLKRKEG